MKLHFVFGFSGLDSFGHPRYAKDWGPTLEESGFVPVDDGDYIPQKGDVVVFQTYPGGNSSGHMAAYDGNYWISDFVQRDIWGGKGRRHYKPSRVIYRKNR
jgi:cell wall-associated NlpC family hydrolase